MRYSCLLRLLLVLTSASLLHAGSAPRPNILLIYTDDQRWDSLSLAGHPFLKTPSIDRIGREGAVFNNSFVTSPLCSPSRASLLTGQYAHTHRVRTNEGAEEISFNLETFPKILKQAGYRTGYLGKFHMGESAGPRPGFDRWVVVPGQGRYVDPLFNIDGREEVKKGYIADILTEFAVEFIDQSSDKPVMEAEHAQSADGYRTLSMLGTSGGFAVQADAETGDREGALLFRFEVRQAGLWQIWLRTFAAHHRQNGLALSIDGQPLAAPKGHALEGSTDIYLRKSENAPVWHWAPEWQPTAAQERRGLGHQGPITVRLEAGFHTLTVLKRKRERPLIDKVVLSLASVRPQDYGPPESTVVRP